MWHHEWIAFNHDTVHNVNSGDTHMDTDLTTLPRAEHVQI